MKTTNKMTIANVGTNIYEYEVLEKFTTFQENNLFHTAYITLHINQQPAGFVRVIYIGDEIAKKKLTDCTQFFIYKINNDNQEIRQAYESNNLEYLCNKFKHFIKPTNDIEEDWKSIQKSIEDNYGKKHIEFVDYWVNKPSRDLIYVLTEQDTNFHIIKNNKEFSIPITPKNWQGQGVGKALTEFSVQYAHGLRLHLWQSKNQTEQGKKLWKFSIPGFKILYDVSKTEHFKNQRAFSTINT